MKCVLKSGSLYWTSLISENEGSEIHRHAHVWGPRVAAAEFSSVKDAELVARAVTIDGQGGVVVKIESAESVPSSVETALAEFVEAADEAELWRGQRTKTPMALDSERIYRAALSRLLKVGRELLRTIAKEDS